MPDNTVTAPEPSPMQRRFKKIGNALKEYFSRPANVITVVFAIFLIAAVIYPLVRMVLNSIILQTGQEARAINEEFNTSLRRGDWTFLQWPYLLFNKGTAGYSANFFWTPLYRSILMSLVACLIAVGAGGTMAFLVSRTNMPFKKFISTVFVFPYIMPSWSIAMFWTNFFKNTSLTASAGKGMLQAMTGLLAPQWLVFGFWPTAFVMGLHYAPFAYILVGGILRNMDANLEEAAIILKATRFKILRRITLPIVAPAIISTVLLVFAGSVSSYTVPYFLNADGSFQAISMTLRAELMAGKTGEGYVIATILMILSVLILTINNWFTKSRRSFTTVSGKSGQISKINLGKVAKWIIAGVLVLIVAFFAIFPLISFAIESLEETAGDISSVNFKYWFSTTSVIDDPYIEQRIGEQYGIFFNRSILTAFGRSILVSLIVALICGTFGILIGYAVARKRRSRLANFVGSVAFLPYLIPALCFGTVFFSLIKQPSFSFLDATTTGSEWSAIAICCIVGGIKFIPFASRSGTNAMLQLSAEIEEAAIIVGAPWPKRMTRIIFPIQKSSFISGYLLPFISCMREYTLFTLVTTQFTLATNVLGYLQNFGAEQLANAINLLLVVLVVGINLIVNKVTGASIDKGIGG